MSLLIDTDVAIHLRDRSVEFRDRLIEAGESLAMSMVTVIELEGGVHARHALTAARRAGLAALRGQLAVLPLDEQVVARYGEVLAHTGYSRGKVFDRLIAATALVHDLTLITVNGADFGDIPGLKLEVWPAPAQ